MVTRTALASPPPEDDEAYFEWLEASFGERPSRRKAKRSYQRRSDRRVVVRGERLEQPDVARLSRALLAAQRELGQAQAEAEARQEKVDTENRDGHS
jgi:hypothetical protein